MPAAAAVLMAVIYLPCASAVYKVPLSNETAVMRCEGTVRFVYDRPVEEAATETAPAPEVAPAPSAEPAKAPVAKKAAPGKKKAKKKRRRRR